MQYVQGDRPYPCNVCPKRFTQKAHLIIHKRTHTGEKPYSCHICHKRFAQSSHLAVHKRIHTGEKPFFCNFCGMGFCRRPRLEAHIIQHMVKNDQPQSTVATANQESIEAATQLMELKMTRAPVSQVKSEPIDVDDAGGKGNQSNVAVSNSKISDLDDNGKETKLWDNKQNENELDTIKSGLTELTSFQRHALNKSLVMQSSQATMLPRTSGPYLQDMHTNHPLVGQQNPNLTMSGLIRTNTRVSLIDFTAEDILQHLLTRDDIKSCDFCCLVFKDPAMYYLHRSMHDKMDVRCCNLCGKLLKDKYDFTAHYLNEHK